jgi:hypothetical protein
MDLGNLPDYWALLAREFQTLETCRRWPMRG